MKNNYREIIRKHIREYEQKLELVIMDRYLFNIFANDYSFQQYQSQEDFTDFERSSLPSIVFGDPVVRFDYENVLININDIRFPFANIFKDIYLQQNPNHFYDYLDLQTEIITKVMIFEKGLKEENEIFVFFNGEGYQTIFSHYDDHYFDYRKIDDDAYDPFEEINNYKNERKFNGSDFFKILITLLIDDNHKNTINIISIPENMKYGDHQFLFFDFLYLKENLDRILSRINYKSITTDNLKFYDYFEFIERFLRKPTIDFIISQYANIYYKYNEYFYDDFIGNIIRDYKKYLVEEIKITSNFIANSNYPINIYNTLKFQIGEKLKGIEYETMASFSRYSLKDLEKMVSRNNTNQNFDLLNDDDVFRAIITSEYLYSKIDKKNYLDNSSVCVGYLKSIELILYKLLSKKLKVEKYSTIGSLIILLETHNNDNNKLLIDDIVVNNLRHWNIEVRNGFFHKDIMMKEEVDKVRVQTMKLIYDLLNSNF